MRWWVVVSATHPSPARTESVSFLQPAERAWDHSVTFTKARWRVARVPKSDRAAI